MFCLHVYLSDLSKTVFCVQAYLSVLSKTVFSVLCVGIPQWVKKDCFVCRHTSVV